MGWNEKTVKAGIEKSGGKAGISVHAGFKSALSHIYNTMPNKNEQKKIGKRVGKADNMSLISSSHLRKPTDPSTTYQGIREYYV